MQKGNGMRVSGLTKRQIEALDTIKVFTAQNGRCPTFRELGECLGLSSLATVHKLVWKLIDVKALSPDFRLELPRLIKREAPKPPEDGLKILTRARLHCLQAHDTMAAETLQDLVDDFTSLRPAIPNVLSMDTRVEEVPLSVVSGQAAEYCTQSL